MRIALFILGLAIGTSAAPATPVAPTPATAASRLLSSRQHVSPRALVDVCASLDIKALASIGSLASSLLGVDICLCLSAFPLKLSTNVGSRALLDLLGGQDVVETKLKALINSQHGHTCTYPPHARSYCSFDNPCGFSCEPGRVDQNGQCVCAPGTFECNGVCQASVKVSYILCFITLFPT
jgi:hypothetical protein